MVSEYRWQRTRRRGTRTGQALARLPFALWLRLMLAAARINPFAFDNHFRPQADFVPDGAAVFRLEDGLTPLFDWLAETTGGALAPAPPHALRTAGATPDLTEADRARIARAFAVDYARFGYAAPAMAPPRLDALDLLAKALAPGVAWLDRRGRL